MPSSIRHSSKIHLRSHNRAVKEPNVVDPCFSGTALACKQLRPAEKMQKCEKGLFCSILFYSILFYSILFYSILECVLKSEFNVLFNSDMCCPRILNSRVNKAFVGFKGDFQCDEADRKPIATGKWGCGSFFGCVEYKWLIQWIAASECERKMLFCSSTSKELEEFNVLLMKFKGMKVGEVAKILFDLGEKVKQRLTEEENKDPNPSEIIHKLLSN